MTESTPAPDEPPTALPPPAVIRVLTINVQGGLTPNLSHANCTKDKLARACDFLDAGYVCVCAQECGFLSDSPPPSVSAYLLRRGASIRCVGRRRGGEASVAILLAPGWHFTKVFRYIYDCEIPTAVRRLQTAHTLCSSLPSSFPRTSTPPATAGKLMYPSAPPAGLLPA